MFCAVFRSLGRLETMERRETRRSCDLLDFTDSFLLSEKSPGTKASSNMKPIQEDMEDDVFEESSASKSHHMSSVSSEEV